MNCTFEKHSVFIDGKETEILSGAIHYFRNFPEQWEDRLRKLRDCGFNTVETYAAWHWHEEEEGKFDFSGRLDIVRFIQTAQALGLYVIVRPGPYICSECDLGGLPGWLLGKPGIRLRCSNPVFMAYAEKYFAQLLPLLKPLQCNCGGPVIAMQLENEYGSYGDDREYMRELVRIIRKNGIGIQLFTSDGALAPCLKRGTLPDLPATVNYRNHPAPHMECLRNTPTGYENPAFTMELWTGCQWHWGEPPRHHDEKSVAEDFREILRNRWHVNCYMFHGGTNFGFSSGANWPHGYTPQLTSYEVDALLDESGRITPKYDAVRRVMNEFGRGEKESAANVPAFVPEPFSLTESVSLHDSLDLLSKPVTLPLPETMEHFGQSFGFIQYARRIDKCDSGRWEFLGMMDRAVVMLNGSVVAVLMRGKDDPFVVLSVPRDGSLLEILVENTGRINCSYRMEFERKGMLGLASGMHQLMNWEIRSLPMRDLTRLRFAAVELVAGPRFYRGSFEIPEKTDLFLEFPAGTRGFITVNGFKLGRYWNIGPQKTLYCPAPVTKAGRNEVVVFDTEGLTSFEMRFAPGRIVGPLSELMLP